MDMKRHLCTALSLAWITCLLLGIPQAYRGSEYHGADSVFERDGIIILWAVLKGQDEASSQVCMKILHPARNRFKIFSVEAVDPFSKEKEWVVKGNKLEKENFVRSSRASFGDKTARRIFFYRTKEAYDREKPDMTVYYLGVPDTSPEVLSEKEMNDYFEKALERLKK